MFCSNTSLHIYSYKKGNLECLGVVLHRTSCRVVAPKPKFSIQSSHSSLPNLAELKIKHVIYFDDGFDNDFDSYPFKNSTCSRISNTVYSNGLSSPRRKRSQPLNNNNPK